MKTIAIFTIIPMIFFAVATPVSNKIVTTTETRSSGDFSFVRTHRQGKGAEVSWAFTDSNAAGFTVERTNEDPNDPYSVWFDVANVTCNSSRSYKAHDGNPFPGLIHYRVIAVMNDGSVVSSPVSSIKIAH